jgi:hypothetical protein
LVSTLISPKLHAGSCCLTNFNLSSQRPTVHLVPLELCGQEHWHCHALSCINLQLDESETTSKKLMMQILKLRKFATLAASHLFPKSLKVNICQCILFSNPCFARFELAVSVLSSSSVCALAATRMSAGTTSQIQSKTNIVPVGPSLAPCQLPFEESASTLMSTSEEWHQQWCQVNLAARCVS